MTWRIAYREKSIFQELRVHRITQFNNVHQSILRTSPHTAITNPLVSAKLNINLDVVKGVYLLTVLCTFTIQQRLSHILDFFHLLLWITAVSSSPCPHRNGTCSCPLYALCVCAITHVLEEAKGGKICELFPFLCLSSNLCVS